MFRCWGSWAATQDTARRRKSRICKFGGQQNPHPLKIVSGADVLFVPPAARQPQRRHRRTTASSFARVQSCAAAMGRRRVVWWAALALPIRALVLDMPTEKDAHKLSAKKFRARYARKGLPVVMRGSEEDPTFDELGELCPDATMETYTLHPEGKGWAGFSDATPITVKEFVRDETQKIGMGLDLKCACDLEVMLPPFLRDDRHRFSEFQRKYWPSLVMGRKHASAQMHGSDQMLPWWFRVVAGQVDVRVMTIEEWRPKFATGANPLIVNDPSPDFAGPFDAFDDDSLDVANVTLYKTIAKAGDWVYAPVGALRATRVIGEEPVVAAFGFFFDAAHRTRLLRDYCDRYVRTVSKVLAPLGARTCGYRGHGRAPDAAVTDPCLLCLEIAGATDDASTRGKKPPSWSVKDAAFSAGEHPPACSVESRFSRECPGAARCPPPRERPAERRRLEYGDIDLNGDRFISRQETAVAVAQAAAFHRALPLNASYEDVATWVQTELDLVWPAGKPSMTDRALDEALRLGTERWAAADEGREFVSSSGEL